ncbi:WD40 repeat-like protein [Caulochytrium protostelioides]|uniref:WD40 repeat-like protein n=1 Tax=Caulochytrium protostelioides TaxID=1555241 RepID=A0A4V1ITI0_9FUNG|nr:WD40 repeat-like protein [Caulochytrium protostelioides]
MVPDTTPAAPIAPVDDDSQIQVQLISRRPEYAVSAANLLVPLSFKRMSLSSLINHLLERETNPVPFDFVSSESGTLIRTSLKHYLASQNLNAETVLKLEYFPSVLPPTRSEGPQQPDWITAVRAHPHVPLVLTGCANGELAVCRGRSGTVRTAQAEVHASYALSAVAWLDGLTDAHDDRETLDFYSADNGGQCYATATLAHGVTCLAASRALQLLAVSDTRGPIEIFDVSAHDAGCAPVDADADRAAKRSKKSRTAAAAQQQQRRTKLSKMTLAGHSDRVTALAFATLPNGETLLYSAGWDSTIRVWDVATEAVRCTIPMPASVVSMAINPYDGRVATGHTDRQVRVWGRLNDVSAETIVLSGHMSFVSDLAWSPSRGDVHHLASCCYDGVSKLWDTRLKEPLFSLKVPKMEKLLALDWKQGHIYSAGDIGCLHLYPHDVTLA